ncbi:UNVERIFIED_CONTAM: hypothetical protein FKN15_047333 [Acipenser sinensis]
MIQELKNLKLTADREKGEKKKGKKGGKKKKKKKGKKGCKKKQKKEKDLTAGRTLPVEKLPGLAMEEEERQVLQEAWLKKEPLEEARGSLDRFSRALFKADLNRLENLMQKYHKDVNMAFESIGMSYSGR